MFLNHRKKFSLILSVLFACMIFSSCSEKKVSSTEFALNTVITITAYGDRADEAMEAAFDEIKRIESVFSSHVETSEVSKINKSAFDSPVEVSDEVIFVLQKSLEMSKKTKGSFDISIKPLVDLWNVNSENPEIPSDGALDNAKSLVNYKDIVIDVNKVSFKKEGMKIDLGAAVKGYCADKAVEVLKSYGIKNALLDLGGNIYAIGKNEQGGKWRIGLRDPSSPTGEHFSVEEISNLTAVTSGSYERYFEKDGKIYHHIIDPETGYPADSGFISVTVIGESSFEADMLSTAIFVMGRDEFVKSMNDFNYKKIITVDKNNTARTYEK